jgi:hypothetical protein
MAALHASLTPTALADMHIKLADDWLDRRHVFLICAVVCVVSTTPPQSGQVAGNGTS